MRSAVWEHEWEANGEQEHGGRSMGSMRAEAERVSAGRDEVTRKDCSLRGQRAQGARGLERTWYSAGGQYCGVEGQHCDTESPNKHWPH